ncbi:MAG: NADH-quinone oxidoreductase subunit C [Arachnia sp.]
MADPIAAAQWRAAVQECLDEGYDFCNNLVVVDELGRSDQLRVVCLLDRDLSASRQLETLVGRSAPVLDSIADLLPGAAWLERQAHDMFGVEFTGGDDRPLLHHGSGHPLRKDVLLTARLEAGWPGAVEPGQARAGRRSMLPPGVPERSVLDDPAATAEQVAMSAAGMRNRRRG